MSVGPEVVLELVRNGKAVKALVAMGDRSSTGDVVRVIGYEGPKEKSLLVKARNVALGDLVVGFTYEAVAGEVRLIKVSELPAGRREVDETYSLVAEGDACVVALRTFVGKLLPDGKLKVLESRDTGRYFVNYEGRWWVVDATQFAKNLLTNTLF